MQKTKKPKKSGPAIFMYCVIAVTAAASVAAFALYYGNILRSDVVLWIGITAFTIMYHLWMRIIMGNVSKLFPIHYTQWWFQERAFEPALYRMLRVKKWKDKAMTYNPELFSLKDRTLEEIANTTAKAETDHWINELISLSTLLFAIPWGQFWIFFLTAVLAMLFDVQFIVIQRYNRPRILRLLKKRVRQPTPLA